MTTPAPRRSTCSPSGSRATAGGLADEEFLRERAAGLLDDYPSHRVAEITGMPASDLVGARLYGRARQPGICSAGARGERPSVRTHPSGVLVGPVGPVGTRSRSTSPGAAHLRSGHAGGPETGETVAKPGHARTAG
ncbi:hypothetical protein ACIGMX_40790 [Streptomyces aquilus]|uniref:Uncharacterized protein n=1 Tax=Streptomyces aquilus TaxID=2548456 RepID=A0A3S9HTF2_9ACTN|nr:hypothetical protein [Streptomyces aquilus]AZP15416.1 hypothetical protein EJC51_04460 [Streptomyces aquilus]